MITVLISGFRITEAVWTLLNITKIGLLMVLAFLQANVNPR